MSYPARLGRRQFLKAMGAAPVAAPLALRKAVEEQVNALSQLSVTPLGGSNPAHSLNTFSDEGFQSKYAKACMLGFKQEIIRHLYQEQRYVGAIDFDLVVLKAPSLAAKICWQRERNVKNQLRQLEKGWDWEGLSKFFDGILGKKS